MRETNPIPTRASCLYEGVVSHRRAEPAKHEFRFPLYMLYIDLDELPTLFDGSVLYSATRPAPARFKRSDYLGDEEQDLSAAVRDLVQRETGHRPDGPIRLLTHLRHFGYCFNPVSFYYCFDASGEVLDTIVAQITNTPWRERHAYVLPISSGEPKGSATRFRFDKIFHVSPFMPMDVAYDWAFTEPADRLAVHMNLVGRRGHVFDATLQLGRREITPATLRRALIRYPLITGRVMTRIHWEALRLWIKRVPVQPHPKRSGLANPITEALEP